MINCETKVKVMGIVNCMPNRFTVKLKLRAQFARRMDDDRPHSKDRLGMQSDQVQGPVAAVHPLLGCLVKDVKGTGDP